MSSLIRIPVFCNTMSEVEQEGPLLYVSGANKTYMNVYLNVRGSRIRRNTRSLLLKKTNKPCDKSENVSIYFYLFKRIYKITMNYYIYIILIHAYTQTLRHQFVMENKYFDKEIRRLFLVTTQNATPPHNQRWRMDSAERIQFQEVGVSINQLSEFPSVLPNARGSGNVFTERSC